MYLGVKMVIAKSFARIHKGNLINHGVIPAVFADPAAYDHINLDDDLAITDLRNQMKKKSIEILNKTTGKSFAVKLRFYKAQLH